jgi:hypothetical protein
MAFSRGPFTLVLNVAQSLLNPTASGGNPATAIQIQNSSGFVLSVLAGGEQYTIQSFTAQVVPLIADGSPITVDAVQSTGTTANKITVVWLLAGESPPMTTGPLTAAAIVAAITGTVSLAPGTTVGVTKITDPVTVNGPITVEGVPTGTTIGVAGTVTTSATSQLLEILNATSVVNETNTILQTGDAIDFLGATSAVTGTHIHLTVKANKSYSGIIVMVHVKTGAQKPVVFQVIDTTASAGHGRAPTWSSSLGAGHTGTATTFEGVSACSNESGDTLFVTVWFTANPLGTYTVIVYGITSCPVQVRPDGRSYPIGSRTAQASSGASGTTTLVAASASGLRIFVRSLDLLMLTNSAAGISGTINGTTAALVQAAGPGATAISYESGLLLDPATSLVMYATAANGHAAAVVYDLVV